MELPFVNRKDFVLATGARASPVLASLAHLALIGARKRRLGLYSILRFSFLNRVYKGLIRGL